MIAKPVILAIDPGYDRLGWAVGQQVQGKVKVFGCGCITTLKTDTHLDRCSQILTQLQVLADQYQPEVVVMESLFFTKNVTTAMKVAEIRGLILGVAIAHQAQVAEYTPSQLKLAAAGNGRATKTEVEKMVRLQLGNQLNGKSLLDDTLDALALLITHTASVKMVNRV